MNESELDRRLDDVRRRMVETMAATAVGPLMNGYRRLLAQGKMLRSRLAWRVGAALGADPERLAESCAAVELIHGASLLHDDVIDGGYLRRGLPAFWVERGIPGAILLGDLMVFQALRLLSAPAYGDLLRDMIRLTGEVCEAESEQELMMRGPPSTWDACVEVARRKTGALFALAAVAGAGTRADVREAVRESGYLIGTAYQLADDFLDATGDPETAGKTLGSDEVRQKSTAFQAAAAARVDVTDYVELLITRSVENLKDFSALRKAWTEYAESDLRPALERNLRCHVAL